jgi:aspartate/methionine/tyrosine aminotransferase
VAEALRRLLCEDRSLHWYPDPGHEELCAKLSGYVRCRPEHLLITNGSDDALALVCQTYIDAGDEVVAPFPTYRHFLQFAELANAAVRLIRKDCRSPATARSSIWRTRTTPRGPCSIRRRSAGWPAVTRGSCSWSTRRITNFPAARAPGGRPRCRTWS